MVSFEWHPGMSLSQKQKSIASLHQAAREQCQGIEKILEISSKSLEDLGVRSSAFNLKWLSSVANFPISVECAFQGSKVFLNGGPFTDLYEARPIDAKRDVRLRSSGNLKAFDFDGGNWPIEPQTAFYDWLYISALRENPEIADAILSFDGFTDIEFNPKKSINCQAYSAALFCSLYKQGMVDEVLEKRETFLNYCRSLDVSNARQDDTIQGSLF
ncbi:hypothetical protein ED21_31874 [Erythrobacter sp. SD-21]|nr:hypothetical protein ED21_31874 [Erythrobacter sp. SD-21]